MRRTPQARRLHAAAALALVLAPAAARANGFALDLQGTFANGTAGAGAAAARDPAAQFANPAVLAALDETHVVAGGMLVVPSARFTDGGSTILAGAAPLPGSGGDGASAAGVPWIFASHRLRPSLVAGFGVASTFGLATRYAGDFVGRYQGTESRIEALAFGPALAWSPVERWAVGASVAARYDRVLLKQALDLGSACVAALSGTLGAGAPGACQAQYGLVPGQTDGSGRFKGTGWGWTANVGVTFEPVPGTTLGLAWRHEAKATVKGDETFALPAGAAAFFTDVGQAGALGGSRARLDLDLPDFVTLSAAQKLGKSVTLHGALQYSLWSRFDTVTLRPDDPATGLEVRSRQGYRNAVRLAVGAAWSVRKRFDLYGGVAYEQSPITDAHRQATLPERDSILVGLGGEVALTDSFTLSLGAQHVEAVGASKIDQTGEGGDRLVGTAKVRATLALLQVGWRR
ncbi:MAG TPA: outer membrane protein transport protein [Anaeromyxobacteraceae bacterium]|nr:outer membrane protein transport protein [Anaeromyxobacteraceae bacterium]